MPNFDFRYTKSQIKRPQVSLLETNETWLKTNLQMLLSRNLFKTWITVNNSTTIKRLSMTSRPESCRGNILFRKLFFSFFTKFKWEQILNSTASFFSQMLIILFEFFYLIKIFSLWRCTTCTTTTLSSPKDLLFMRLI